MEASLAVKRWRLLEQGEVSRVNETSLFSELHFALVRSAERLASPDPLVRFAYTCTYQEGQQRCARRYVCSCAVHMHFPLSALIYPLHISTFDFRNLPLSAYCVQHILHDPQQQLYKACTHGKDTAAACATPIVKCEDPPVCDAHLELKSYVYNPRLCVRVQPTETLSSTMTQNLPLLGIGLDEDFQVCVKRGEA